MFFKMQTIKKFDIGFTQVSNVLLYDKNLSLKAKGLYAYLFSKPDNWIFHNDVILQEIKEGSTCFKEAIKELEKYGYIKRVVLKGQDGRVKGVQYLFLNKVIENKALVSENENQIVENQIDGNPIEENHPHNNTNINNTYISNTNTNINNIVPDKKSSIKEENEKYVNYSLRLKKYVEERKRKSIDNKTISNWNNSFRLLVKSLKDFRTQEEIDISLNKAFDYLENRNDYQGKYKLVIESADSFREKFTKIEDKIVQDKNIYPSKNYAELEKNIL